MMAMHTMAKYRMAAPQPGQLQSYKTNIGLAANLSTCGLMAMTSAQHAEGRQFDPGQVYKQCLEVALCLLGAGGGL